MSDAGRGIGFTFSDGVAATAGIVFFLAKWSASSSTQYAKRLEKVPLVQIGDIPQDGPPVLAAVEGITCAQRSGNFQPVPARQTRDALVWRQQELLEKIVVNKHGGQDDKLESVATTTKSIPWAISDSSGQLSVDHSMPEPPLESILAQRRKLLLPAEVERLSTYKRVFEPRAGRNGGKKSREVRTETAVARCFKDSVLTAGTLLTVIGSIRYDRSRGMTVYAAGDLSYVGRQDLQTLIANAYGSADSAGWVAKAALTIGGIAALWGVYKRFTARSGSSDPPPAPPAAAVPPPAGRGGRTCGGHADEADNTAGDSA